MENSKVFSAYKWYIVSQIKFEQCKEICRIYNDKVDKHA